MSSRQPDRPVGDGTDNDLFVAGPPDDEDDIVGHVYTGALSKDEKGGIDKPQSSQ